MINKPWSTIIQEGYPFYWLALFPLMGVTLQEADVEQAVECVKHMLIPPQQRLPDDLTELLERGEAAWEQGQSLEAKDLLQRAFQCAQAYHYV